MFTEQEKQLIVWGKANGKSEKEVKDALVRLRSGTPVAKQEPEKPKEPGYIERVGRSVGDTIENILVNTEKARKAPGLGIVETGRAVLRTAGDIAGTVVSPITEAVAPALAPVVQKIAEIPGVQDSIKDVAEWAARNPKSAKDLGAIINIVGLAAGGTGTKITGEVSGKIASKGVELAGKGVAKAGEIAGKAGDVAGATVGGISRIPSWIVTNVADRKATIEAVKELPTKIAQTAAKDGIDIPDVKFMYNLPKEQRPLLKELAEITKRFAKGDTTTNPIEVVGKPIVERIKQLESARTSIGKKLGEAANNLGVVTRDELFNPVFEGLKKVPGLDGLTVSPKGILDFAKTTLASELTDADRKAIQKIFSEAVKWGNGKQKHLLRQELFEVLGGKKRSLQALTDTQDKAFQSIRKSLSDVLEDKNGTYKTLSNEYRKVVQPLADMRKFMKSIPGAEEDVLDMSAGLLARRLTSNAPSNPQIRNILKAMDEAAGATGKSQISTEVLQDFYNILDKYYDIAGKTGFKGQIKSAIEGTGGVANRIAREVSSLAGETPAVRQKALEDILKEILGE